MTVVAPLSHCLALISQPCMTSPVESEVQMTNIDIALYCQVRTYVHSLTLTNKVSDNRTVQSTRVQTKQ